SNGASLILEAGHARPPGYRSILHATALPMVGERERATGCVRSIFRWSPPFRRAELPAPPWGDHTEIISVIGTLRERLKATRRFSRRRSRRSGWRRRGGPPGAGCWWRWNCDSRLCSAPPQAWRGPLRRVWTTACRAEYRTILR